MPIYEYQCSACGNSLEKIQKFSDAALKDCPECGKPALEKQVSAGAFRLKGSGWYETDFKTGKKKNIAGNSDKGSDKSSGKSEAKSDGASKSEKKSSSSSNKTESSK